MGQQIPKTHDPATWVDEHADALFRFAILRVKDESIAEDLVQDTFLSALKGIDNFRGQSSLRTWLVGILKHKIIDYFRRNRPEISAGDLRTLEGESEESRLDRSAHEHLAVSDWKVSPDGVVENEEFWGAFSDCLDGLPENQRRAFAMRELDGIRGDEICKILGITSTNLWVMLHRARLKLRGCLESTWFGR